MVRRRRLAGYLLVAAATSSLLSACSSTGPSFDSLAALRGVDTILAGFKPDAAGNGPILLSCPFGSMPTIGAALADAAGVPGGTVGKSTQDITRWSNTTDAGRAINCSASSSGFAFDVGVQRGLRDEHPAAGAAWNGPYAIGGGKLYVSTSTTVCSAAWAKPGTFFTVGVQIAKPALSAKQCRAAGTKGVTLLVKALTTVEPFNVVPSSSAPSVPSASSGPGSTHS